MRIKVRTLTREAFTPFGQILMAKEGVPERHAWAAKVQNYRKNAQANITYMSLKPAHYPVAIKELERHPASHQLFVPLDGTNHLLVVCPSLDNGDPDITNIVAFHATGVQSVNYNANIWHAPRTALEKEGSFVMMRWDSDTEMNTELFALAETVLVEAK